MDLFCLFHWRNSSHTEIGKSNSPKVTGSNPLVKTVFLWCGHCHMQQLHEATCWAVGNIGNQSSGNHSRERDHAWHTLHHRGRSAAFTVPALCSPDSWKHWDWHFRWPVWLLGIKGNWFFGLFLVRFYFSCGWNREVGDNSFRRSSAVWYVFSICGFCKLSIWKNVFLCFVLLLVVISLMKTNNRKSSL